MKKLMNSLVSGQQSAFLKNRQITDASLIANEMLDWRIKSGESGILCKLDIEKAFDQLNWAYLVNILKTNGIWWWVDKMDILLHFNSEVLSFDQQKSSWIFLYSKGVEAGGIHSVLLFILAMEGLSQLLARAKELQWIQGFQVGSNPATTVNVSHLLYADDTIIFCGADKQQVSNLNTTLIVLKLSPDFILTCSKVLHIRLIRWTI